MADRTKNIWITGAGSGIGAAIALQFASAGHTVLISGRNAERLDEVSRHYPNHILPLVFDVTDETAVATTTAAMESLCPWLDLVILNAGSCEYTDPPALDPAMFRRVMDTNFFGLLNSFNVALPLLRRAPARPHLSGVASMARYVGFPRAEAYGASKAAAAYLLNSLRADFGRWLDVTVINPGFVTTPMTASNDFPMPFLISAEDAARRIVSGLASRPLSLNFPRRLHWCLRLAQLLPGIWYKHIIPRLQRPDSDKEGRHG